MQFELVYSVEADETLERLEARNDRKLAKVQKTLGLMQTDIRNKGLQTHKYSAIEGPNGEPVFEAYVENNTPGAYRVIWHYGPGKGNISIISIIPHPG